MANKAEYQNEKDMIEILAIQSEHPEIFEELKREHPGEYLVEIAKRGDGNQLYYIIGDEHLERLLWRLDNLVSKEDEEFIGSSVSVKL
jgi:hypothetical protein